MTEYDDEHEPESNLDAFNKDPIKRALRYGCVLPAVMLVRALGTKCKSILTDPALCVVLVVKADDWVAPFASAARALGRWNCLVEGNAQLKTREKVVSEGLSRLAIGERLIAIYPETTPVPRELSLAADHVIELKAIRPIDVSKAIRLVTGGRARGVAKAMPADLELGTAIMAIRSGSTPAMCVRRLGAEAPPDELDPFVRDAPPLDDLHGYGEAMLWAQRLAADIKAWKAGELNFSAIQRNAVLAGIPGTGKSTFVRSIARTTGLPLISTSLGQMFSSSAGYLDSIVKQIDQLFAEARSKRDACIVFIDELEAFPDRGRLSGREASWWTPVVNHLLTVLDGALSNTSDGLVVIGATNHPDRLDPALLRNGRMDRVIWIDLPDEEALVGIYRQHLGGDLQDADLEPAAAAAVGSTGAMAAGHVKGARARARGQGEELAVRHLMDEICPPSDLKDADLWRACIHEAGHAIVCFVLEVAAVKSISVTGGAGGIAGKMVSEPRKGKIMDERSMREQVAQILAGRAAEEVLLGSISGGSGGGEHSDLAKASNIIAAAHLSLGLRGALVHVAHADEALSAARRYPALLQAIETDLQEQYEAAKQLVVENAAAVEMLAERLRADRVVTGKGLRAMLEGMDKPEEAPHA